MKIPWTPLPQRRMLSPQKTVPPATEDQVTGERQQTEEEELGGQAGLGGSSPHLPQEVFLQHHQALCPRLNPSQAQLTPAGQAPDRPGDAAGSFKRQQELLGSQTLKVGEQPSGAPPSWGGSFCCWLVQPGQEAAQPPGAGKVLVKQS